MANNLNSKERDKGYYEETQDEMADVIVNQLGLSQGRILYPTPVYYNATIESIEDGSFWYGDLEHADVERIAAAFPDKELIFFNNDDSEVRWLLTKQKNV